MPRKEAPGYWQRVEVIRTLLAEGLGDQILVSHDIGFKSRLSSFGGSGYHHILTNALPIMKRKGVTDEQLDQILVANPRRLLEFAPAKAN